MKKKKSKTLKIKFEKKQLKNIKTINSKKKIDN